MVKLTAMFRSQNNIESNYQHKVNLPNSMTRTRVQESNTLQLEYSSCRKVAKCLYEFQYRNIVHASCIFLVVNMSKQKHPKLPIQGEWRHVAKSFSYGHPIYSTNVLTVHQLLHGAIFSKHSHDSKLSAQCIFLQP